MLLASFLFALMNVAVKELGTAIPSYEVVFFRGLGMLLILIPFAKRKKVRLAGNNKLDLIIRALSGTASLVIYFYTIQHIPLASAVTLQYLSPIFAVVLSFFILKEKVSKLQIAFFGLSFLGVVFIKQFDLRISVSILILGVCGAFLSGIAYTYVRKLKESDHYLTIIFYFALISLIAVTPFCINNWVTPNLKQTGLLIFIGLTTFFAQIAMTKSYHLEKMRNVAGIRYIGLIYALTFGMILFGEFFDYRALLGMLLVTAGVLGNIWFKSRYS